MESDPPWIFISASLIMELSILSIQFLSLVEIAMLIILLK